MTAFELFRCLRSTAANTTQRNGSSYRACMTVLTNNLDTVSGCVKTEPVHYWQGYPPFFWSHTRGSLDPASLENSGSLYGCASDRSSELPWYPRVAYYWVPSLRRDEWPHAIVNLEMVWFLGFVPVPGLMRLWVHPQNASWCDVLVSDWLISLEKDLRHSYDQLAFLIVAGF